MDLPDNDGPEFGFGDRVPLFDFPYYRIIFDSAFDVNKEATRFVAVKTIEEETDTVEVVVVQNWFDELEEIVP